MQWKMRCLSPIHFPFLITFKSRKQNYVVYYIYQLIDAFRHSCSIAHTDSSLHQVRVHFGTLPHTWGHTSTVAIGPQDSRIKYPCIWEYSLVWIYSRCRQKDGCKGQCTAGCDKMDKIYKKHLFIWYKLICLVACDSLEQIFLPLSAQTQFPAQWKWRKFWGHIMFGSVFWWFN